MPGPLESQFQTVVGVAGHGPVVRAEDTLVIVGETLAAQLGEEAHRELRLHPGLVHGQGVSGRASPGVGVLGGQPRREPVAGIGSPQTRSAEDETRVERIPVFLDGNAAVPDLAAREIVGVHRERVLLRPGAERQGGEQDQGQPFHSKSK